jgi:hypothetical protein
LSGTVGPDPLHLLALFGAHALRCGGGEWRVSAIVRDFG